MTRVVTFTPNPAIDISTSVEKIVPTHKLRCAPAQRDPGGGGINVARVIARLAGEVTAVYPVGGATGQLLRWLVDREGISSVTFAVREETREDFTVHEETSRGEYRFVMPGPLLSEAEWRGLLGVLAAIEAGAGVVVASGSLPAGLPDDFYARTAKHVAELGARFVLDTSGPALAEAMSGPIYLLKPSFGELSRLLGEPLDGEQKCIRAARRLVMAGKAEIVALTMGHHGALLVTRDEALRAPPLRVKVASAVGAGDSFLGAMVWSLARGDDIRESFRYGVAAGTAAVMYPGTQLCRATDVHDLYRKVVVEPVEVE